jgi:quinol-cytochrome oxidoreductase complex cytochrome b subunit
MINNVKLKKIVKEVNSMITTILGIIFIVMGCVMTNLGIKKKNKPLYFSGIIIMFLGIIPLLS